MIFPLQLDFLVRLKFFFLMQYEAFRIIASHDFGTALFFRALSQMKVWGTFSQINPLFLSPARLASLQRRMIPAVFLQLYSPNSAEPRMWQTLTSVAPAEGIGGCRGCWSCCP